MTDTERHALETGRPIVDPASGLAAPETDAAPGLAPETAAIPATDATPGTNAAPAGVPGPAMPIPPLLAGSPPSTAIQPLADVIARPERRSIRAGSLLVLLAGAVAIGGLAFAVGRLTAPATTAATAGLRGTGQLPGGGQLPAGGVPGRGQGLGMSIQGTVTAVTSDSITVELASGSTVTIPVDAATTYRSAATATADTVKVGSEVAITPGARVADPDATPDADAQPGLAGGDTSFGAASEVTVVEP